MYIQVGVDGDTKTFNESPDILDQAAREEDVWRRASAYMEALGMRYVQRGAEEKGKIAAAE